MRDFCGFAIHFRLTVMITIFRYRKKNSTLSFQVTVGLKCNSVIFVWSDCGSSVISEFPELSEEALKFAMQFSTTYLYEKEFSSLLYLKTKYRNRLSVIADLRLKLTNIKPDIQDPCKGRQDQQSR
ncbi:hypothetical protein B7P43_G18239 [Cryptotermes secundus]|uniref:HAT C-terminal dimerisation domain-containing protein n=1 Tax=Cryptotermes secundus TaxID=105785 RepID=A0A2J7PRG4_9NEOP|nr:hypothetical protein B7P43_G18239 [Cryptotermes secundus]